MKIRNSIILYHWHYVKNIKSCQKQMEGKKGNMSAVPPYSIRTSLFLYWFTYNFSHSPSWIYFPPGYAVWSSAQAFNSNCSILIRSSVSCFFWTCGGIPQGTVMCPLSCTDAGNSKCMVSIRTSLALCTSSAIHCDFLDLQCQMTKYLGSTVGCWMYIFKYINLSQYKTKWISTCVCW